MSPIDARWQPDVRARRLLAAALAFAVGLHLYGLYTPAEPGGVELFAHADKVLHFLGFAVPSVLAVLLTRHWWPIAVFAGNAVLSEIAQHLWLPGRDGDLTDVAADLLGLLPALALYRWGQARSAATASSSPTRRTSAAPRRPNE
ncbi:MAG: VanZ family protein [Micropruina sp.]|nr:VanZ family protein [Micropruina sp.]